MDRKSETMVSPSQPKSQRFDPDPIFDVYCWGNHGAGQLGLGGIEEEQIHTPRLLRPMHNRQIAGIACGESHTLFMMRDGTVYSCGCNDSGQLGHEKPRKRPGVLLCCTNVFLATYCFSPIF